MRILTLKLKTFLDSEKVFRCTRRVLLDPNDNSSTFLAFWIQLHMKIFQTADSPKNEGGRRSKNRQFWRYFPRFAKINGLDELVAVISWGPQARRKCILSWVSGLQSLRYIRSNLKKLSKNQVGGGYKWVKIAPPHLDFRKRQEFRSVICYFSFDADLLKCILCGC